MLYKQIMALVMVPTLRKKSSSYRRVFAASKRDLLFTPCQLVTMVTDGFGELAKDALHVSDAVGNNASVDEANVSTT